MAKSSYGWLQIEQHHKIILKLIKYLFIYLFIYYTGANFVEDDN
jgi:hypothetical protein